MAKKPVAMNRHIEWENKLPSAYRTLVDGFHSDLTVDEFAAYVPSSVPAPEQIKNIKLNTH